MSQPTFPRALKLRGPRRSTCCFLVAMEELGLSHIINAEGEKLQSYSARCRLTGGNATLEDVCAPTEARDLLESASQNTILLHAKMASAFNAP